MPLGTDVALEAIAATTHGYTGSDIAALAKEAALVRLRKIMPTLNLEAQTIPVDVLENLTVDGSDFEQGLQEVHPSALREVMVEVPKVRWDEVGGLTEVKLLLHEMVELPLNQPAAFTRLGIRPSKGILLYGPPGTGKTMIAKAIATEAGVNFLTAKGSTLLSKWYGESEKKIAEFFQRARQVAPAILFFDELDSLAPRRGGSLGDSHVTERVVNQLLAEMDGMEELRGVVVVGATNRPDMIDPALLRPGRFDEIVYVSIPDRQARGEIFRSHELGESEKKIAEFFQRARQVAPAILFFDELDSLAPRRGGSLGDSHVTERVVNQLLAEMDGMEELRGVVVVGATNRPDMIDPALLRPGRFDEIVYVSIPDRQARWEIFRSHMKKMALAQDVDLDKLAEITERFSGADIAGVCIKAGIYALRESVEARHVTMEHFFRAVKETIPSMTPEMEREYQALARQAKQQAVRIGFGRD